MADGEVHFPDRIQRAMPSNLEAEQALLGAILFDNAAYERVGDLRPEHFFEPFHQRLYGAMEEVIRKGGLAEPRLLVDRFRADPGFEQLGGLGYLADLIDRAPTAAAAGHYASVIHDLGLRRELIRLGGEMAAAAQDPEGPGAIEVLAEFERRGSEIAVSGAVGAKFLSPADMITAATKRARERTEAIEFPSGVAAIDDLLGGLHRGEVTLLAARPGMGKTIGAQLFAKTTASRRKATLFFSLEMSEDPMALRLACDLAFDRAAIMYSGVTSNITMDRANKGRLSAAEWDRLDQTAEIVRNWPIRYDTRPGLSIAQIEGVARREFRRFEREGIEPGLLVIDHLGKVRPTANRQGSRHNEVADISRDTAEMAKRLGVPVLALVQLNRQVETRGEDKQPVLSDLRQAGELEEDARQVVFLYRPEYYLREGPDTESAAAKVERETKLRDARGKLYWIVEKNSHGPRGRALSYCEVGCSAIRDWDLR